MYELPGLTWILAARILVQMANSDNAALGGDVASGPLTTPAQPSSSDAVTQAVEPAEEGPRSEGPDQTDETRWNRIIPEASRSVPIGNVVVRRPGRGRQALSTPATGRVTPQQQGFRIWAIRQQLGEPVGITHQEIGIALAASGWDLGTALRRMNDILNQARHRHRTNALDRRLAEQQRERLLGADSLHHNRRLGIDFLYTRLTQAMRPDQIAALNPLTLGQLLADHQFDVDEAVNAHFERERYPDQVEHYQRMERRLRMVNPNQLHQDQRVARFMEIAGTDDYYAARGLLTMHGFDMLRAMEHWMRYGLASQPIPPSELNRSLFRAPRRPHADTEDLWPHPRSLAGRLDDIDADDLADADADYDDLAYPNRNGWFIRYPRGEARIGINVPTRQRCDYLRRGEFTVAQMNNIERQKGSGVTEPFDYNDSEHVRRLNNAVTQWFRRVPGESMKEKGEPYQDDENEWIWWWYNERFWEVVEANPELLTATTAADWPQAGVRWPIRTDTQRLTRDYNYRWTQQIHLPGMNGRPRQPRDSRSLDAQRRRVTAIVDDFGFPYSPAHGPKKTGPGAKPPRYSSSGSESEDGGSDVGDAGDAGDDGDGDRPRPRKKQKLTPKTPKTQPKKSKPTPKSKGKDAKGKSKVVDDRDGEDEEEPEIGDNG